MQARILKKVFLIIAVVTFVFLVSCSSIQHRIIGKWEIIQITGTEGANGEIEKYNMFEFLKPGILKIGIKQAGEIEWKKDRREYAWLDKKHIKIELYGENHFEVIIKSSEMIFKNEKIEIVFNRQE